MSQFYAVLTLSDNDTSYLHHQTSQFYDGTTYLHRKITRFYEVLLLALSDNSCVNTVHGPRQIHEPNAGKCN